MSKSEFSDTSPPLTEGRLGRLTDATFLGIRRAALLEVVLFFVLVLVADAYLFEGRRFLFVAPHPFWIIILLVAVQYGTAEALMAAVGSVAVLYMGNLPPQNIDQDLYQYLFSLSQRPMMWLAASVFLGELTMRQKRKARRLREALAEGKERDRILMDAYHRMSDAKESLEARVAGQLRTVFTLYQAAKAMEKLGPGEVLMGVSDLVRAIMNPKKFSLFLLKENALEVALSEGWSADDGFDQEFDSSSLIFQNVVGRQRFLSVADPEEQRILGSEGVMAGPLYSVDTGEVVGMLKIEQMLFLDLQVASVESFKILCDWIGTAFAKSQRYQEIEAGSLMNPEKTLLSSSFFERQSSFVRALAQRQKFDVSMILLKVEGQDDLTNDQRVAVAGIVNEVVTANLRTTDMAFEHQGRGRDVTILLPATPFENARVAADKLVEGLKARFATEGYDLQFSASLEAVFRAPAEGQAGRE